MRKTPNINYESLDIIKMKGCHFYVSKSVYKTTSYDNTFAIESHYISRLSEETKELRNGFKISDFSLNWLPDVYQDIHDPISEARPFAIISLRHLSAHSRTFCPRDLITKIYQKSAHVRKLLILQQEAWVLNLGRLSVSSGSKTRPKTSLRIRSSRRRLLHTLVLLMP